MLLFKKQNLILRWFVLGFATGRDSATFRDKGTTGQAQNLVRDGTACQHSGQSLFFCQDPGRDAGRDNTIFFPVLELHFLF